MLKQVYLYVLLATTISTFAQQSFQNHRNRIVNAPAAEAKAGGISASGWRLQHIITYNASNSQWNLHDSINYIYPDAYTGDENGWLHTEEYIYTWNVPQQLFVNNIKWIITFNVQGKLTSRAQLNWDGTQWKNFGKFENTYDSIGNQIQYSEYTWFANNWYEIRRIVSTYNLQGYVINTIHMDTTGGGGNLVNQYNTDIVRDGSNRQTSNTYKIWSNSAWVNSYKEVFYYTGSSTNDDSVYRYNWNNNAWSNASQKTIKTYGLGGLIAQKLTMYYNINTWVNSSKSDYTYDANGNNTTLSRYRWQNNSWVYDSKYNDTYSATNKLTETIALDYNFQTQQLENWYRNTYSYDANDLLEQDITYSWANSAWDINHRDDYFYEYVLTNGINHNDKVTQTVKSYPNPFSVNTIIEFTASKAGLAEIAITDITGKVVYNKNMYVQSGTNSFLWDALDVSSSSVGSGIYIVSIKADNTVTYSKLMKQ